MEVENEIDAYLVNTDYSQEYPTDGLSIPMSSLPTACLTPKSYESFSELETKMKNKGKGDFLAIHINAVSLMSHFDSIEAILDKLRPDALCISETRLKDKKLDYQLKFVSHKEYNLVYDNSPLSAGGVAIYIRHKFKHIIKKDLRLNVQDCESIFLEVDLTEHCTLGSKKYLILGDSAKSHREGT